MSDPLAADVAAARISPWRAPPEFLFSLGLALFAFLAFYFSTSGKHQDFDYTARIAQSFLQGHVGMTTKPPSWLPEMVPLEGRYYSVFPLGAVLSVMPVTILQKLHVMRVFPWRGLAALLAAGCVYFFFCLSATNDVSVARRAMLALFPIFATWSWCNLGFAGSWQVALGFALLGQAAALYYTLVKPRPLVAGAWFALAVGNRTELVLAAPIFVYFWASRKAPSGGRGSSMLAIDFRKRWPIVARFLAIPVALGLCTAVYNFTRFGSPFDFGYARIPGILAEPWYRHGVFSLHAIPWNVYKMLLEGVKDIPNFPYFIPYPFGCSIFLSSPFLFLLFREGGKYAAGCWITMAMLVFVLLCHGNPGGWQYSYRYGMILLPWMFLLILGNGPRKISARETTLFCLSVAINAVAAYQFLWTDQIKP